MADAPKPDPKQIKEARALLESLTKSLEKSTEAVEASLGARMKAEAKLSAVGRSLLKETSSFEDEKLDDV